MGEANTRVRSVLLVTTELRAGGTERCVTELATRLDPKKFKCQVVSLAPFPEERTQFYDQLKNHDIPLASLEAGSAWSFLRARRRLVKQIDQFRPDWVLSFLFHANVLTAYALKRFPQLPHLANIRVADPRNWRLPLERRSLRQARKIICVSEAVKQHCQQVGNYPAEKLCVIPNGVDVAKLDRQMAVVSEMDASTLSAHRSSAGPHVGFGGRLDPQKGLDQLIHAWPSLLREFPEAQLWIAGDGPQRRELELQAQRLGLEDRLHWLGWQPEPWRALQHCSVLVFPSRWEGMSNALLEGMGTGTPVVANEIEGVQEVLGAGPRVQLAQPDQPESLVRNLSQVLSDQELASECGDYNRQRIEQHYSIDGMIRQFTEVMESTV